MKTRYALLTLFCWAAFHAYAQPYSSSNESKAAFQSQQLVHPIAHYKGTVYSPFMYAPPSEKGIRNDDEDWEDAGNSSSSSQGPKARKGFITPPEINRADDYPIGEPWIMALFAAIMGTYIAIKQKRKKKKLNT